jgi:beta-lactamase regulating signal transducer with metallopeptidase domain
MTATSPWLTAGWTMLHFLWVGGLIRVVAAVAGRALRGAPAEARYALALASLALLALAPAAIAWRLGLATKLERATSDPEAAQPPKFFAPVVAQSAGGEPGALAPRADHPVPAERAVAPGIAIGRPDSRQWQWRWPWLDAIAACLPWLWLAGSPITFAWLALGLAGAERLRHRSVILSDGELPPLCRRLAQELGILRNVAVAVCDRLVTPVLVGVVRPLILLPPAALSGWEIEQVEMVLLHELAHVRRWDNLINLVQRLVESLLFFQPAVWIVSSWVRREREHCCDRLVVARTGRARAYAETLLALAGPEASPVPWVAVGMARNHLVARVRQVLDPNPKGHAMKPPRGLIALTATLLIIPAGLTITRARTPHAETPAGDLAQAQPKAQAPAIDPRALRARALELAEAVNSVAGAKADRLQTFLDIGASLAQRGDRAGAVDALRKASKLIDALPPGHERTVATMQLAMRLGLAGKADKAIAIASGLKENDADVVGILVRSSALCTISQYLSGSGNIAKAREAAERIADKGKLGYALSGIAVAQVRQGDPAAAIRTIESIENPEGRIKALAGESWGREHPGLAVELARAGDPAGAPALLDRARVLIAVLPDGAKKNEARAGLALAQAQLGDIAEGLRQVRTLSDSNTRDTALG